METRLDRWAVNFFYILFKPEEAHAILSYAMDVSLILRNRFLSIREEVERLHMNEMEEEHYDREPSSSMSCKWTDEKVPQ